MREEDLVEDHELAEPEHAEGTQVREPVDDGPVPRVARVADPVIGQPDRHG